MSDDAHAVGADLASSGDLLEPPPRHRGWPEGQVHGAPVHGHERAGAEPFEDVERAVGIDVDTSVEGRPAPAVIPDRHHPADREECRVDHVALPDLVEHGVIREVDVAGVVKRRAPAGHHVAERLGRIALAPAALVVARGNGGDLGAADHELVTRGQLRELPESQVGDDPARPHRDHQVRVPVERLERPPVQVIDVRMRHEHGIDASRRPRARPEQRVEQHAGFTEFGHGRCVAEPRHAGGVPGGGLPVSGLPTGGGPTRGTFAGGRGGVCTIAASGPTHGPAIARGSPC